MYGSPAVPLAATPTNWVLPAVWSQVFRVRVSRPRLPEGEQTEWMENGSFILYNFRFHFFPTDVEMFPRPLSSSPHPVSPGNTSPLLMEDPLSWNDTKPRPIKKSNSRK